jgi:hypothetical protein
MGAPCEPGERFVYFTGPVLIQSLPVVAAARKLHDAGEVMFVQERTGPGVRDYIMLKRRNAEPPAAEPRRGRGARAGHRVDEELEDLMAVLRRLAALGAECPTNAKLAAWPGSRMPKAPAIASGCSSSRAASTTASGGAVSGKR